MRRFPVRSRWSLVGLLLAAVVPLIAGSCGTESVDQPVTGEPNVLVILIDDLRPDLGVYGQTLVESPSIDRLAARGLRFDRAYAQASVCKPSRVSLLTGRRPATTGIFDNRTPAADRLSGVVTLPAAFDREGYFTASIGKIFHGSGRSGSWTDSSSWDVEIAPKSGGPGRGSGADPSTQGRVGRYRWNAIQGRAGRFVDVRTAERAIAVLEERPAGPFFMMVGLTGTHPHFEAPAPFFDLYPLEKIPLPAVVESGGRSFATQAWSDQERGRFTDQQQRQLIRAYWACVSFVDGQVGRILDALDRLELTASTIVVLTSDHGYHLGEHDWWTKHTLYEEATRVPLIMAVPGIENPGQSTSRVVELIDLYPTLMDFAGIEAPAGLEGLSLRSLFENPQASWKNQAISQMKVSGSIGSSIRTARWRYTEWRGGRRGVELYDHQVDPQELDNLADQDEYQRTRKRLRRLLRRAVEPES